MGRGIPMIGRMVRSKWNSMPGALLLVILLLPLSAQSLAMDGQLARQVLAELNLARTNPGAYAQYLREFRGLFHGKAYRLPGSGVSVLTAEGVKGVDEAIRFLSRRKPLPPFSWSPDLAAAAAELAADEGESGAIGHRGRAAGGPEERIGRQGLRPRTMGENISYGPAEARQVVMNLIIDDGVPGRGHRKNIFLPAFSAAGAACGPHPRFGTVCVIDFAGE